MGRSRCWCRGICSNCRRTGSLGEVSRETVPARRDTQGIGKSAVGFRFQISNKCQKSGDTIFLKGGSAGPAGGHVISFSAGRVALRRPGRGLGQ